jgi:hypothetical protein
MRTQLQIVTGGMILAAAGSGLAAARYADANSFSPTLPYTSWATAASTIQQAVDAAAPGDEIVVTNGTYATGGRTVGTNLLVNRVAADKPIMIRSVNGPQFTVIQGHQVPGTTNGDGAIRCVYLTNGASLSGFTLTNGATGSDGDSLAQQSGGGVWCESGTSVVSNCVVMGNSASDRGGGVYRGMLDNCTLSSNRAVFGGGACGTSGIADTTLNNCTLTGNWAGEGGGAYACTLNNCTVTGNSAAYSGGGASYSWLNNCIVYFNMVAWGEANFSGGTLNYCCTTPLPPDGIGNIALDPQLASASRLSAASPCRGAGSAAYATGTDIDGEAWASPPSIGCDEYHAGGLTGPLTVGITIAMTNVAVGYPVGMTAIVEGKATASAWDFGDGLQASNQPYAAHAWTAAGNYTAVLHAYNESQPAGISATVTVHVVSQPVHYVAANSGNPVAPYTSWGTAASNVQDAIDAAAVPGALVLVTNGIFATGGRDATVQISQPATNRVTVDKSLTLRSANGPQFTVIQGDQFTRCVYLARGATLSGFTLTNGVAHRGAGVFCEAATAVLSNCVLVGNSARDGGGTYGGTLYNCRLSGNTANNDYGGGGGANISTLNNCVLSGNAARYGTGGGALDCTLNNCTLTGNLGGGAWSSTLNNCIVYFNTTYQDFRCRLNYCCTAPLPSTGFGNITNSPLFVDLTAGDLRLQPNSPCINAGDNAYALPGPDLDGNPRIAGSTVDIGAYEFQNPPSVISNAWLQQNGLPIDGSADTTDPDADGLNNWQEWRCGTDPTNARSVLRMLVPGLTSTNVTVSWQSVAGVSYFLERSTDLAAPMLFTPLAANIPGQSGTTTYTDTNAVGAGPFFYRVGVGN